MLCGSDLYRRNKHKGNKCDDFFEIGDTDIFEQFTLRVWCRKSTQRIE